MDDRHSVSEQSSTVPICGIGASAGGLEALQKFFAALPNDLGLAYVVIVHLAPDRKSELPAILARWTSMPVIQVGDSDKALLVANHVYVIAPDRKLEITDTSVGSSPFVQVRGRRESGQGKRRPGAGPGSQRSVARRHAAGGYRNRRRRSYPAY